jgi:Tfp pilus assembly protein PilF
MKASRYHLSNYALFLRNNRKDLDGAERYYRLALEADPKVANNLTNYAGFLLAYKDIAQHLSVLDTALGLPQLTEHPSLAVELWFYALVHRFRWG